jgi:N-acetyl-gamma-glutamyl-phosphate reductase
MALGAVVLGASGFTGGEVLRILSGHPAIAVVAGAANRKADRSIAEVHPHLFGRPFRLSSVTEAVAMDADVVFSCLPSGDLGPIAEDLTGVVVDLSDEHRDHPRWTYGLTEYRRMALASARRIANPGCYPTAVLLGLLPFVERGLVEAPIVVDALSGTSGAGRVSDDAYSFAALTGSFSAYGTTEHRHVPEIERALNAHGLETAISFTPHLVPTARGLLATVRAKSDALSDTEALAVLHDAYDAEPFVSVVSDWPESKAVAGTNCALVHARVDRRSGWLVISCAIDNLGKGAAGQAIQNANLALGLEETAGLQMVGVWP